MILTVEFHLPLYHLQEIVLTNFFPGINLFSAKEKGKKILCTRQTAKVDTRRGHSCRAVINLSYVLHLNF